MEDIHLLYAAAIERERERDYAGARALLGHLLTAVPGHAPGLNRLARLAARERDWPRAEALARQALAHAEADHAPHYRATLALVFRESGRVGEAMQEYRAILSERPDAVEARINLAILLRQAGAALEAEQHLRLALARETAVQTRVLLALVLLDQERFAEAEAECRAILATDEDAMAWNLLGIALQEQGQPREASEAFEQALRLRPDFVDALYNLGGALKDRGRTDEAVAAFRRVTDLAPEMAAARVAGCIATLPPLYRDEAEIARSRAAYETALADLAAWAAADPARLAPGVGASQPFYLAYQGRDDIALQRRYGALVCRAMAAAYPAVELAGLPAPGERIRVGFVSGFFRRHANWRLPVRGWLEGLDPARFEVIGYHTGAERDAETDRSAALCARFVQGPRGFDAWREAIAQDRPYVLIYPEVGMDPVAARLAALRLAPVQCNSWGHPTTSGYPTLDHFLGSDRMEPEDGAAHYSERLVRLPGLSTAIHLPDMLPPKLPRAELGLTEGDIAYWCGQSLYKYLPQHDGLFPAIARQVEGSRFLFLEFPGSPELTDRFRERMEAVFRAGGLDADRHCRILPRLAPDRFLAAMQATDVALDSVGWSGCNSLIDAAAAGLPIVTLDGDLLRARHGAALLEEAGETRGLCRTAEDYVRIAALLGRSPELRGEVAAALRRGLRRIAEAPYRGLGPWLETVAMALPARPR